MFYFLSKLLLFLIQPAMWIMFAVLAAFICRSHRRRKRYVKWALLLFLFFGNSLLLNLVISGMEQGRIGDDPLSSPADYAVVLGGYVDFNQRSQDVEFHKGVDRFTKAMDLYNKGLVSTIVLSSGVCGEDREKTEAEISKGFLVDNGIPAQDIHCENFSWNTYMNAFYSKQLIDSLNLGTNGVLLTSAFHMKRASECFEKQGLELQEFPVDYISKDEPIQFYQLFWPSMEIVMEWNVPMKEWVGRLVYRLKGYT